MDRSAIGVTAVFSVSELLAGAGSDVDEEMVALLTSGPLPGAVPVMVMLGAAPTARLARVQVRTPETGAGQVHPVPEPVAFVRLPGSVSATETFDAASGPALAIVSV